MPDQRRTLAVLLLAAAGIAALAFLYLGSNRPAPQPGPAAAGPGGGQGIQVSRAEAKPRRDQQTTSLQLLLADGGLAATPHVGEELELRFGSSAHRYALVVGVEQSARGSVLWPARADRSGALEGADASVRFRATAGDTRVVAAFSDQPLSASEALSGLPRAGVEARELTIRPQP